MYWRWKVNMNTIDTKSKMDKRIYPRTPYSGHIFFVAQNGFNEGLLKNYSRSGLFINTKASLDIGEIITIALPYVKNKELKYKGQILRRAAGGFGIELFRTRRAPII